MPPSEPGRNTFEFEGVGKKDIPSEIWESFTPNTQNSIRAAFTLVNQANLPIDLAVLSILRCIEIEFISKFINKFNNQFYKNKPLKYFKDNSLESNIHFSLFQAVKYGSFTLGEMETLGDFLAETPIELIKSPLIKNFLIFLGNHVDEFCNLCADIKSRNEKGDKSKNCSYKFLNDYEAATIRELRNKIAHGDRKITKIDKITFKRIYLAMIKEPLKILIHIVLLSEQIESH